jgi:hypothetical protein
MRGDIVLGRFGKMLSARRERLMGGLIDGVLNSFCGAISRVPQLSWRGRSSFAVHMELDCFEVSVLPPGSLEGLVGGALGFSLGWLPGLGEGVSRLLSPRQLSSEG